MSWRHRDILEAELHEPKGFTTANNGDSIWRNEQGLSEWTDREVLPAALNFVDASVAPPTTASGDIYVLSLGASIHANWGTVALKDWVRYDGNSWKVITPSKSILCYDKTLDVLMSYDGSVWATVGSDTNIANANLTFDANHYSDLSSFSWTLGGTAPIGTEKISLQKDTLIKGSNTSVNTKGFKVTDSANTSLLEVKNNGRFATNGSNVNSSFNVAPDGTSANIFTVSYLDKILHTFTVQNFGIRNTAGTLDLLRFRVQSGVSKLVLSNTAGSNFLNLQSGNDGYYARKININSATTSHSKAVIQLNQSSSNVSSQLFFANITMTTLGRTNSSSSFGTAEKGFECFDTDLNKKFVWNGSAWEQITSV